jgi:mannosyltransferase
VFPSLYEGFGLPPVEAAARGIPVVVSRIPAHEEALRPLADGEVEWFPPEDADALATALRRAEDGRVPAPALASRGRLAEAYSVDRLARDMDRVYRRVLGIGG